jgi:hypothetical protein
MKTKRTMAGALAMTPQEMDFIKGNPPPTADAMKERSVPRPSNGDTGPEPEVDSAQVSDGAKPTSRRRPSPASRREPASSRLRLKMSITTRLNPETVERLRRTRLERSLAGTTPSTLEEIIEEAVQSWLASNAI